jgi:serine/threonine protein kinase
MQEAQAEAQLMQPLRHRFVTGFYGIAMDQSSFEIKVLTVIELCKCALEDQLEDKSHTLSWAEKLRLAMQMAQGMAFLHAKGIIHRDLKPANGEIHLLGSPCTRWLLTGLPFRCACASFFISLVLIGLDGFCKIADFGMAKKLNGNTKNAQKQAEMTANVGTPIYMAPELMVDARKLAYSTSDSDSKAGAEIRAGEGAEEGAGMDGGPGFNPAKLDVYSYGVMLFYLFTQEKPYDKELSAHSVNIWTLRDLIVGGTRPDVESNVTLQQGAPIAAVLLMKECWDADPSRRPSGFDEIQDRLAVALKALGVLEVGEGLEEGQKKQQEGMEGEERSGSTWQEEGEQPKEETWQTFENPMTKSCARTAKEEAAEL